MSVIEVAHFAHPQGWSKKAETTTLAHDYCAALEAGNILYFSRPPFDVPQAHVRTLLSTRQSGQRFHKNISYQPDKNLVRGCSTDEGALELAEIMKSYSRAVTEFADRFLIPYAGKFKLEYGSYRPVEERGRAMQLHKRNDLLHVDAFPTRPTRGARILRVFTNLNPSEPRSWITGMPFAQLAGLYAQAAGLQQCARTANGPLKKLTRHLAVLPRRLWGHEGNLATAYDEFMHGFHNYLKENERFQNETTKHSYEFPPGSSWLVYTDSVPHAVLGGQYAIEQTLLISLEAMVTPENAPLKILEKMCAGKLAA